MANYTLRVGRDAVVEAANVLETYPAVEDHTSPLYTVTLSQGGATAVSSPVCYSDNPYYSLVDGNPTGITLRNHWSQFSYTGSPVTVVVTAASGSVSGAQVRPSRKVGSGRVNTTARTITFSINQPGQYFVACPSLYDDPIFIFASAIDTDVPVVNGTTIVEFDETLDVAGPRPGATTVVFPAGVHETDLDYDAVTNNVATAFTLAFGEEVYIHGGAWVKGKIRGTGGSGVLKVRGRGTLSGEQYLGLADLLGNEIAVNIASNASGTFEMSGITITDSARKNFICSDGGFSIYDVKVFGVTGDFATMTSSSTADLCFTKVNDDHYKFFGSNAVITNATCYMQKVGPIMQCSWSETGTTVDNLMSGVDIVGADRPNLPDRGGGSSGIWSQTINNAVIKCGNIGQGTTAGHLSGTVFEDFRSDVTVWQVIGLDIKGSISGFTEGLGDIDDFTFRDMAFPATTTDSHINANGTSAGTITNLHFENLVVAGSPYRATDEGSATVTGRIRISGTDSSNTFTYS